MQPDDRPGDPGRRPHPVEAERHRELRQRQRRPDVPARFLPQASDHSPALAGGQPGYQVDGYPVLAAFGPAMQSRRIVRSSRKILIADANHNTVSFHAWQTPVHMRKARKMNLFILPMPVMAQPPPSGLIGFNAAPPAA
jgi:hypothetical protein